MVTFCKTEQSKGKKIKNDFGVYITISSFFNNFSILKVPIPYSRVWDFFTVFFYVIQLYTRFCLKICNNNIVTLKIDYDNFFISSF